MKKKSVILVLVSIMVMGTMSGCGKFEVTSDEVNLELGDDPMVHTSEYIEVKNEKELENVSFDFSKVDNMKVGKYEASVKYKKKTKTFEINVEDTTAPVVVLTNQLAVAAGTPYYASDMIKTIDELSGSVMVSFKNNEYVDDETKIVEPDEAKESTESTETEENETSESVETVTEESTETPGAESTENEMTETLDSENVKVGMNKVAVMYPEDGEYDNVMTVIDASGNECKVDMHIVVSDLPVINNVTDIIVQKGSDIDYLYGVNAIDGKGNDITGNISVDSTKVDANTVGTYEIIYTVTDAGGLTTSVTAQVSIVDDLKSELEKEDATDKRAVSSTGTSSANEVKESLNKEYVESQVESGNNAANTKPENSQTPQAPQEQQPVNPPSISPQSEDKGSSTNGVLNAEQKSHIDSMVQAWRVNGSDDTQLSNDIANYLAGQDITCSFGSVRGKSEFLKNSWEDAKAMPKDSSGIYNYMYISTDGNYVNGKLQCYKWNVDIY